MDAIEDILKHPAYYNIRDEAIANKRLQAIKLMNELKSLVASSKFTVMGPPDPDGMSHYKECCCKYDERYPDRDMVGFCTCSRIESLGYKIIQLLDDIQTLNGDSWINRLKRFFSRQLFRSHRQAWTT